MQQHLKEFANTIGHNLQNSVRYVTYTQVAQRNLQDMMGTDGARPRDDGPVRVLFDA